MSFYKTRNPVFAFLLPTIGNFLRQKTKTRNSCYCWKETCAYNGYQDCYAIWIERNITKEDISSLSSSAPFSLVEQLHFYKTPVF